MNKLLPILFIICTAVAIRLIPHIPNFTPIGAMALFGGAHLPKRYAFLIPLFAMFLSDLFLGLHPAMIFVYLSFLLIILLGILLSAHKSFKYIFIASFVSSILFFIITNFGVWVMYDFYPKNISGLMECYGAGVPFFRNTLLSDFFYTFFFFGGYALFKKYIFKIAITQ